MATCTVRVELPKEIVDLLGTQEGVSERVLESLVMLLLRDATISQGTAARLLGLDRWELLPLLNRYGIESGPETPEQFDSELEFGRRTLDMTRSDVGRQ